MDQEIHYLTYDTDSIWREMMLAYIEAGGDILYPGDEKEMLLRGVLSIITHVFAGVDAALRMDTLRYAAGEYLDLYGEKRNCVRIPAAKAACTVEIDFSASGESGVLEAGTLLTADGERMYALKHDVVQTGLQETVTAEIEAAEPGQSGNGLYMGAEMQMMRQTGAILSIRAVRSSSGGQDAEDDESYRERIRVYGLSSTTTGTKAQYESAAMRVSSEIVCARALSPSGGVVSVYLITEEEEGAGALCASVESALNAPDIKPLTDTVEVHPATKKEYTISIEYEQEDGLDISGAVAEAVEKYKQWQEREIGRAFNPEHLVAAIYQAGAVHVVLQPDSVFDGGNAEYTVIDANAYCKGSIITAVRNA